LLDKAIDPIGLIASLEPTLRGMSGGLLLLAAFSVVLMGPSGGEHTAVEIAWQVRARLSDVQPQTVSAAASALGALEDLDSVDLLLDLLEHPERGVRQSAHRGLQAIAGVQLPLDPARWRLWIAEQRAWYEERAAALPGELASSNRMTLVQALGEVAMHRLHRRDLSHEVSLLLERTEPAVRTLACQVLAQLGVADPVPALIPLLEDPDPAVAAAAQGALHTLTGEALPAEPQAWWDHLARADPRPGPEQGAGGWIKAPAAQDR